jgi:ribosomal protein L11 methyltransferase
VIRLALRVRRAQAELVLAELLELAPSGVEESALGEDIVEYAVYGARGELPELPALEAAAGGALVEVSTSELPDDWGERWKRFHRPVLVAPPAPAGAPRSAPAGARGLRTALPALHVRPPWEPPSARAGACEIVIDPAQAFGTGAHATTRLCLELLLELAAEDTGAEMTAGAGTTDAADRAYGAGARGALLDVGTGSGVLAIAARKLGFAPVCALDNDVESVRAARANAHVNSVDLDVRRLDLRREALPWAQPSGSGVIVANLLRPLLLDLSGRLPAVPRHLLASGLLRHEVDEIADVFGARHGLRERARRHAGEWGAVWLVNNAARRER